MKVVWAEPSLRYQFHDESLSFFDRLLIRSRREQTGLNRRMFDEDFARIFRSSSHRSGGLFEVSSNNDKLANRLLGDVKTQYGPHPIDETIRKMVEDIAQSLIWYGDAFYFLQDEPEKEKTHVASFSRDRISNFVGLYFQFLPKRRERHWDREDEKLGRELRLLNRAKLMHFRMPRSIKRMLSAQNVTLASLDKHLYSSTDFFPETTHENPNPENNFDFRAWNDSQDDALYRATRETGWNGRKYDYSKRSDFFDCHRLIRFRRNQLFLRDDILAQLSNELTRVGKHYDTDFDVKVSATDALPSIAHLTELEARLSREEADFTEVIDYCYKK